MPWRTCDQRTTCRNCPSPPTMWGPGTQELSAILQAWWQVSLPTKTSWWPWDNIFRSQENNSKNLKWFSLHFLLRCTFTVLLKMVLNCYTLKFTRYDFCFVFAKSRKVRNNLKMVFFSVADLLFKQVNIRECLLLTENSGGILVFIIKNEVDLVLKRLLSVSILGKY